MGNSGRPAAELIDKQTQKPESQLSCINLANGYLDAMLPPFLVLMVL